MLKSMSAVGVIAATLCVNLVSPPVRAETMQFQSWDFKVHRNVAALARATTMWQVGQASRAQNASQLSTMSAGGGALGSGLLPSVGSVANMNVVTVIVGNNSTVDVATEADQKNWGTIDATAVSASSQSGAVSVGNIK